MSFSQVSKRHSVIALCKVFRMACTVWLKMILYGNTGICLSLPWPSPSHNEGCGYLQKMWSCSHGNKQHRSIKEQNEDKILRSHLIPAITPSYPCSPGLEGRAGALWTSRLSFLLSYSIAYKTSLNSLAPWGC